MTEEQARTLREQQQEFPQTMAILAKVREALAAQVFLTPVNARDVREDLYTRVQAIDALTGQMKAILQAGADEKAIREYAESIGKQTATTG